MSDDSFDIFSRKVGAICVSLSSCDKIYTWFDLKLLTDCFVRITNNCRSPIERSLATALMFEKTKDDPYLYFSSVVNDKNIDMFSSYFSPQVRIGQYTVDFLITTRSGGNYEYIVVECDGHDFHEKTKQQAAHDKKRDRFFTQHGYKVLRFTGSEIFNKVEDCANEIINVVNNCVDSVVIKSHIKNY